MHTEDSLYRIVWQSKHETSNYENAAKPSKLNNGTYVNRTKKKRRERNSYSSDFLER